MGDTSPFFYLYYTISAVEKQSYLGRLHKEVACSFLCFMDSYDIISMKWNALFEYQTQHTPELQSWI